MREVLQVLVIMGATAWAVCLLTALWIRHRVRSRLRISPTVRSTAPTVWLASPSAAARLHHRLRRVATSARAASTVDLSLTELADQLVISAVALEPAVVAVAKSGRTGASLRRHVARQISELELVAQHLTQLATRTAGSAGDGSRLHDRVDALAAARQELTDVEMAAGLYARP